LVKATIETPVAAGAAAAHPVSAALAETATTRAGSVRMRVVMLGSYALSIMIVNTVAAL
jgi:hypothetical protein